jgi:hypothetical protein
MRLPPNRKRETMPNQDGWVIEKEIVMLELPRGKRGDVLRVTFTKAKTPDGKPIAWHAIREFYTDANGNKLPGKKGITIRGAELKPIADALAKACSGGR